MDLQLYPLRRRITDPSKPPLVILPVTLAEPAIAEIMGFAGAEALLIDAEHGSIGPETMRLMLAHARSVGVPAVFRPVTFNGAVCRQALDAGAAGIQVSHVDTEAEAEAAVSACRYPPLGQREMSLGRAIGYDPSYIPAYVAQANECQLLVLMIESLESVKNVEKIAAVPGIDVLEVGLADLAHAMGLSGQHQHPDLYATVEHVLRVAQKHGVALGLPISDPRGAVEWAAKGVRYFEGDTPDYVLREVYAERLAALNKAFKEK